MPQLNLTVEDVGSNRSRRVLVRIESIMLYPDNEAERRRAEHAGMAQVQLDEEAAHPADNEESFVGRNEAFARYKFFAGAVPIEAMQAEAKLQCAAGAWAASRLTNYLGAVASGAKPTLGEQKKEYRRKFSGTFLDSGLADATLEKVWSRYRPVAHLWAAYVQLGMMYCDRHMPSVFPCYLDDLPFFLGTAESFRRAGEECGLKGYAGTLLVAGTSWKVPTGIDLPLVDLRLHHRRPQT